jgi:hypothetical protein
MEDDTVIVDFEVYAELPAYMPRPIAFGDRGGHLIHDVFSRPIPGAFGADFLRQLLDRDKRGPDYAETSPNLPV